MYKILKSTTKPNDYEVVYIDNITGNTYLTVVPKPYSEILSDMSLDYVIHDNSMYRLIDGGITNVIDNTIIALEVATMESLKDLPPEEDFIKSLPELYL